MNLGLHFKSVSRSFLLSFLFIFLVQTVGLGVEASARQPNISAKRFRGEHWKDAYQRTAGRFRLQDGLSSAVDVAVPYAQIDVNQASPFVWGQERFMSLFTKFRDLRFLPDPEVKNNTRRISWMYPDDGCFIRAEWLAKKFAAEVESPQLSKIFAFGDLSVSTKNHPSGRVSWWYHVVVGWKVGTSIMVYDPAIEPMRPLPLANWIGAMSSNPSGVKIAICGAGTYGPSTECSTAKSTMSDREAVGTAQGYLREERARLIELNRKPDVELGNNPPWLKLGQY